ncbi:cation:proton antiporter [bacterium]|nr:cation:proton antiporter [bacterium]
MGVHYLNEHNIFIFLVQVFLLLGLSRGLGEVFRRWRQPAVTAEILVGLLLGPTVLGRLLPNIQTALFPPDPIQLNMLETVAWVGVFLLLLETGLEVDFSIAWRQRGDALKIAISDIILPMIISFIPCLFLPGRYLMDPQRRIVFASFMAAVMTISAMPITARALHDLNLAKTELGFLIMSALAVNDVIGWLVFTIILGLFIHASPALSNIMLILFSTIGFAALALIWGRSLANFLLNLIRERQMPEPGSSLTFICLLGVIFGAITQKIGIHALFGFFIAGLIAGEAQSLSEETRGTISQMVYSVFVPLFFANIGLKIDLWRSFDFFLVAFISIIGIAGRFYGAWIGCLMTDMSKSNRSIVAVAHTPGGSMEIVVGLLALEYKLITESVFVAIVFGAVISSVILGPWLKRKLAKRKEIFVMDYLQKQAILPNLKASNKDEAIHELCKAAAARQDVLKADDIYHEVLRREADFSTALEHGLAIPHARLENLDRPVIAFGRSLTGLDWNSPDGKLTRLVFLLITPKAMDEIQIQILARIAQALTDEGVRTALAEAENNSGIWNILRDSFKS